MKKELSFINVAVLFVVVLSCAMLIFVSIYYWKVVDFFALPLLTVDLIQELGTVDPNLIITLHYIDELKTSLIDYLIGVGFYDLHDVASIIVLAMLALAVVNVVFDRGRLPFLAVGLCVLSLLVSHGVSFGVSKSDVDDSFTNYVTHDIPVNKYVELLNDGNFTELDILLDNFEDDFYSGVLNEADYGSTFSRYGKLARSDIDALDLWVKNSERPETALMVRGAAYYELGWKARGGAFSIKTSEEQFAGMRKYFGLASSDLKRSIELDDSRMYSYVVLLAMAQMYKSDLVVEEIFNEGRKKFPSSYLLAYARMEKLQPKWGGTPNDMRKTSLLYRDYANENPMLIALSGVELLAMADELYREEDYASSTKVFNRALLYGTRKSIITKIFSAHRYDKNEEGVKKIAELCLSHHPENADCYLYRASAYVKNGELEMAKQTAAMAVSKGIESSWGFREVAYIYEASEARQEAARYYMLASDADTSDVYPLNRIYALSYSRHISFEKALPYMRRWTEIKPEDPEPWLKYADTLEDVNASDAVPLYEKYLALVDHSDESKKSSISYAKKQIVDIKKMGSDSKIKGARGI